MACTVAILDSVCLTGYHSRYPLINYSIAIAEANTHHEL